MKFLYHPSLLVRFYNKDCYFIVFFCHHIIILSALPDNGRAFVFVVINLHRFGNG